MPDTIYDTDILTWSEQQADLLRRLAAGERVNAAIDWSNLIDEVETVGRSDLRSVQSLLSQALIHLIKMHREPESDAQRHWQREVRNYLAQARAVYSASMRQRIDLAPMYETALTIDAEDGSPAPMAAECPLTLDDLLAERPDVGTLASSLGRQPHA